LELTFISGETFLEQRSPSVEEPLREFQDFDQRNIIVDITVRELILKKLLASKGIARRYDL